VGCHCQKEKQKKFISPIFLLGWLAGPAELLVLDSPHEQSRPGAILSFYTKNFTLEKNIGFGRN
jgi:hypothetical protein